MKYHEAGDRHANLRIQNVVHDHKFVDGTVAVELQTRRVGFVQMAGAKVFDLVDEVVEGLKDATWAMLAKQQLVSGTILVVGHEEKVSLFEAGMLAL